MIDTIVTAGGIVYGVILVAVAFSRSRITEALRIDVLMVPRATEATRMLNPVIGLVLIGYEAYALLG